MTFSGAVESCLKNYAGFQGRASRSEYWFFILFSAIAAVGAIIVDAAIGTEGPGLFYALAILGLFLPGLAVAVRRLHDIERSGWWYLIGLVPFVGGILLLIWFCKPGTVGANDYGSDPLEASVPQPTGNGRTHGHAGDLDRLDRLSDMLGRGVITQQEYDAEKATILRSK